MTRENLAVLIRWPKIIWLVGIVNPFIMVPQIYQIWATREVAGISLVMLGIITFVQAGFACHGFFIRDKFVMVSNTAAAIMSIVTAVSVLLLQYKVF